MNATQEYSDEYIDGREPDNNISFTEILHQYLRYWKWILLSVIIFTALGYLYGKLQVPKFDVNIKLLIKEKGESADKDVLQQLNLYSTDKVIDNEVQILKSDMLMEKVVKALKLETTYLQEQRLSKKILYKNLPFKIELLTPSKIAYGTKWTVNSYDNNSIDFNGKKVAFDHPVQTDAGIILVTHDKGILRGLSNISVYFNTAENVAPQFSHSIVITPASKESTVLFITMEDENADRGMDILTQLVSEYDRMSIEDKNKTIANTLAFIEGRLTAVAGELNHVEGAVANYKSTNQITDISAQSSIFLTTVQTNDAEIMKITLEQGVLKNLESYLHNANADQIKLPAMQGIDDPTLLSLVSQLGEAQLRKEALLRTIPQTNPVVNSINDQIKALKATILQTLENVRSGLEITKKQLQGQNGKFESLIKSVPAKERGLVDVMREQGIKNTLFTYLLQKREETAMSLASTVSDSQTIDKAKSSGMFFKPSKGMIYVAFFAMGLLFPILIIYLIGIFDATIKRRYDIEKITSVPILGQISYSIDSNTLVVAERPRSMIAEQIRSLRTNLQFVMPDQEQKVILFTSNISGEGKSFVSLNLAASLASTGKKVIVLELDLRRPKFHSTLGLTNDNGISNYLIGKADYKDIVRPIATQEGLDVITSGLIPPNPAELLLNGKIETLLKDLKEQYNYIIMDAPPIGILADAQILARYADTTLFIVRFNYTVKDHIKLIEELRRKRVFKNLNVVFNSILASGTKYGYGYGYGYGYYEEDAKKQSFFRR